MKAYVRYLLFALGVLCVVIGVIGLFVPILQGVIFLVIGLYVLSLTSKRLKRTIDSHLSKYPRIYKVYERYSAKIDRFFDDKKAKSQ